MNPPMQPHQSPPADSLELVVDGEPGRVRAHGTLLDALREDLGRTCVKDGCAPQGQCGACSVLIDGIPRLSCVTPVARAAGRSVTTAAGLAEPLRSRLASSLTQAGAFACGFCTPGILVRAHALLTDTPDAGTERLARALAANLCRCTGWTPVLDALAAASADPGTGSGAAANVDAVAPAFGGAAWRGIDVPLGARHFLADDPDVDVWAVPICAGVASGTLVGVDIPHGTEVVTAANAGSATRPLLRAVGDELADAGDVVALALGASVSEARAAAGGCRVRIAPAPGSPPGLPSADAGWSFVASDPGFLEPEAAIACVDAVAGRIEVVTQSETPAAEEQFLAALWPTRDIDVRVHANGGAFGAKSGPGPAAFAVLVSELCAGRRVGVVFGRGESILWHPRRLPGRAEVDLERRDTAPGGVARIDGHLTFAGGGADPGPNPYVTTTNVLTSTVAGRKGGWPGVAVGGRLRGDGELVWSLARDATLDADGIARRDLCGPAAAAAWDSVAATGPADAIAVAGGPEHAVAAAVTVEADGSLGAVRLAWAGAADDAACRLEAISGAFMGLGAALSEEMDLRDAVPTPATIRSVGLLRAAATPPISAQAAVAAGGGAAAAAIGARAVTATAVAVALAARHRLAADIARLPLRDAACARLARRR